MRRLASTVPPLSLSLSLLSRYVHIHIILSSSSSYTKYRQPEQLFFRSLFDLFQKKTFFFLFCWKIFIRAGRCATSGERVPLVIHVLVGPRQTLRAMHILYLYLYFFNFFIFLFFVFFSSNFALFSVSQKHNRNGTSKAESKY